MHDQQRDAELSDCFQATLTFLYRLLFLLYAESRDLLPVRETRGYREASLTKLKEEVARAPEPLKTKSGRESKRLIGTIPRPFTTAFSNSAAWWIRATRN